MISRVLVLAGLALALAAPSASAKTTWLCRPDNGADPCHKSLAATEVTPQGKIGGRNTPETTSRAPVDCFYVYPTVSEETKPQADFQKTPSVKAVARVQASRYRTACRIWAPVYRQITLQGLLQPDTVTPAMQATVLSDVVSAWRDYLKHDNHGRGVILISHSQGTFVLRKLIAQEIDPKASERKRIVAAYLLGGNVLVKKGSDTGGDFKHIRACHSSRQIGCVVAYSTYDETPPADSKFGRTTTAGDEVLCTNPAALGGGSGKLDGFIPAFKFPGVLGTEANLETGPLPKVSTPWIKIDGGYTAKCSAAGGANVLNVTPVPGGRDLTPEPDATWGLHLSDANIAQQTLATLAGTQSAAWLKKNG